ncbi:MAG: ATPase, T2SS/T4P/T4SS family [Lentisphaerota bacterium]
MINKKSRESEEIEKLAFDAGEMVMSAIEDDSITEIMLNPDLSLWVEHRTKGMYKVGELRECQATSFIYTAAGLQNKTINKSIPFLETELPFDRARFEATIPPITQKIAFTIRKRAKCIYTMDEYLASKIINPNQAEAISQAIVDKKSILICGAPGTGKTTFANACVDTLSKVCDSSERIITLEDVPELQCNAPNVYGMFTNKLANIDLNILLQITLRSRPNRILVGEVRDKAMLELLKAWNVGCSGIATVHSNTATCNSAVQRCIDLAQEATATPPISLICETVSVVVTIERTNKNAAGRMINNVGFLMGYRNGKFEFDYIK